MSDYVLFFKIAEKDEDAELNEVDPRLVEILLAERLDGAELRLGSARADLTAEKAEELRNKYPDLTISPILYYTPNEDEAVV